MPSLRSRTVRAPIALVAAVVLLGSVVFDPGRLLGPGPAGAVLGEIDGVPGLMSADGAGTVSAQAPRSALDTLADAALRPAGPRDGEELLRWLKDPSPVQRIPPRPETLSGYRWPITKVRITQPFGPARGGSRIVNDQAFHDGIDMATFCGDRLYAAHDGLVLAAGRTYDEYMGWIGDLTPYTDRLTAERLWTTLPIVVVIDDGNGYRSVYAHFSKIAVQAGQTVKAGTFLGWEGKTGRASGCHLHYGLFSPDEPGRMGIDPEVVARMLLPAFQVARIDPLRVLPQVP